MTTGNVIIFTYTEIFLWFTKCTGNVCNLDYIIPFLTTRGLKGLITSERPLSGRFDKRISSLVDLGSPSGVQLLPYLV